MRKNEIIQGTTCFNEHKEHKVSCQRKDCKYWISCDNSQNCTMILALDGPSTLQQIGEIFGVTRMRICQIEKSVLNKLKSRTKKET